MITDITIGQYFPGNSPIHKMDARMKIVLIITLVVSIFICKNFLSLGCVLVGVSVLIAISKIPFKTILKSIKPLAVIIAITALLNLFYGDGEPILTIWKLKITLDGIFTALFMAFRIITLVVISSMLTYTTSPTELTDAIESLLKPLKLVKVDVHTIAMTMTIALRFIPTLIEEIDKIMSAQKSRGADMDSGGLIHRAKALIPVLIPLFVSSFRRANELAYAMECRCYRGGEGRTKMKVMKLSARDYVALGVTIVFVALLIALNHLMKAVV
ncbi:MAG: energy-coupling factor transporter transmembrane component T family protein [Eubacterium sp.]